MGENRATAEAVAAFGRHLREEGRSPGTVKKYLRDAERFSVWLNGREITGELTTAWRERLAASGLAPVTVNSMLAAVNGFLRFLGLEHRLRFLKIQRRIFRDPRRELSQGEYEALVGTARRTGRERLALLMEAICSTGVRVSEVRYLTVEAARHGQAEVSLKGKIRVIMLPEKLRRKLLKYAEKKKITSGEIFLTESGKPMSRGQIWLEMKKLCRQAGVAPAKVFPHNLRHLFARAFYRVCRDIVKLADVLGHSSIETTRIYLMTTGAEHRRNLERLRLVI